MPAADRECLLADAVSQLEELTVLVGDLVELAREDHPHGDDQLSDVRLDDVVERAVDRARLHAPELQIRIRENVPAITHGNPALAGTRGRQHPGQRVQVEPTVGNDRRRPRRRAS